MERHNARHVRSALLPQMVARAAAVAVSRPAARSRRASHDLPTVEQASARSGAVLDEFRTERRRRRAPAFSDRQRAARCGTPFLRFGFQRTLSRPSRSARIARGLRIGTGILARTSGADPGTGSRPSALLRVYDAVTGAPHGYSGAGHARIAAIWTASGGQPLDDRNAPFRADACRPRALAARSSRSPMAPVCAFALDTNAGASACAASLAQVGASRTFRRCRRVSAPAPLYDPGTTAANRRMV